MDPFTAIIASIGLATSVFGYSKQKKAEKQSRIATAEVAATQNKAFQEQAGTTKKLSAISAKQEALRKQALIFQNVQQSRNIARATQLARATALSRAANSGAQFSTGFQGVSASITGQGAEQQLTRENNFRAGLEGFALNQEALTVQTQSAIAQSGFNQRIAAFGGQVNQANAKADFGKTLFNTGISLIQNAPQEKAVFQSLFTGS